MKPFRIRKIEPHILRTPFILDVGCGFHSPRITKKYIPDAIYYGIEKPGYTGINSTPNNTEDIVLIDKHILVDLEERPDLVALGVPNRLFDAVIASNTLEHFTFDTAQHYLRILPEKLCRGGVFFAEVPSHRVFKSFLPSNYDGWEHRAFLTISDLVNPLLATCEILEAGVRRDWRNILRSPITLPAKLAIGMSYPTEFTDIFGLSYYVLARRR